MNSGLRHLEGELAHCLHGLAAGEAQLRPRGRPQKWSIQQIVEHLLLSYDATDAAINARIAKQSPTRARPSISQWVAQYTVIRLGYFPAGRKAPPLVTPAATALSLSGEELTHAVAEHLSRLDLLFDEAERMFGGSVRSASHMILGPLSIEQWRWFHVIHGRHHVKQILAIRKGNDVPVMAGTS